MKARDHTFLPSTTWFLEVMGTVNDFYLLVRTTTQAGQMVIKQETSAGCPPATFTVSLPHP